MGPCLACFQAYLDLAAACHGSKDGDPPRIAAPLVRCSVLPPFAGHPLTLTGWLEADQAEPTVLHDPDDGGLLKSTSYRFCASRDSLEPTGTFAVVPARPRSFRITAEPGGLGRRGDTDSIQGLLTRLARAERGIDVMG